MHVLLPDTVLPCMVVKPRHVAAPDKAILYLYGGVTNHWNTQRKMAVRYAVDAGVSLWYPVYPSISQVCVTIEGNMMHGYSCMPVFPESRRVYRETVRPIQAL